MNGEYDVTFIVRRADYIIEDVTGNERIFGPGLRGSQLLHHVTPDDYDALADLMCGLSAETVREARISFMFSEGTVLVTTVQIRCMDVSRMSVRLLFLEDSVPRVEQALRENSAPNAPSASSLASAELKRHDGPSSESRDPNHESQGKVPSRPSTHKNSRGNVSASSNSSDEGPHPQRGFRSERYGTCPLPSRRSTMSADVKTGAAPYALATKKTSDTPSVSASVSANSALSSSVLLMIQRQCADSPTGAESPPGCSRSSSSPIEVYPGAVKAGSGGESSSGVDATGEAGPRELDEKMAKYLERRTRKKLQREQKLVGKIDGTSNSRQDMDVQAEVLPPDGGHAVLKSADSVARRSFAMERSFTSAPAKLNAASARLLKRGGHAAVLPVATQALFGASDGSRSGSCRSSLTYKRRVNTAGVVRAGWAELPAAEVSNRASSCVNWETPELEIRACRSWVVSAADS